MFKKKDYSNLSVKELLSEELHVKKTRKVIIIFAVIGVLTTLVSIYKHNSNFINAIVPLIAIFALSKNSDALKTIANELKNRNENQ